MVVELVAEHTRSRPASALPRLPTAGCTTSGNPVVRTAVGLRREPTRPPLTWPVVDREPERATRADVDHLANEVTVEPAAHQRRRAPDR